MRGERNLSESEVLERVLATLSSLAGVRKAFLLDDDLRRKVGEIEKGRSIALGPLTVHNEGVLECIRRAHVACIVKDSTFRPPPAPTVVLLNEEDVVVGRELIAGEKPEAGPGQKLIHLGKDFVIFYEEGRSSRTRFVLPPVSFAEVEALDGAGFPSLGRYYILDLAGDNMVIVIALGDFQWGMLIDRTKVQLGLLLNVIMPKMITAFEQAMVD